jgi:SAM-dependent methyltransferase
MDPGTANRLLEINSQFYQTFARPFSQTRRRLQPGVGHMFEEINTGDSILDLGCGNGELWRVLQLRGHQGNYVGIDFSLELLKAATESKETTRLLVQPISSEQLIEVMHSNQACFLETDLTKPIWDTLLGMLDFEVILAFASLHHIPGLELRSQFFSRIHRHLKSNGHFILSVWQFLSQPRFRQRIQSWESAGLSAESVDPGDYLLDWKQGGYGIRYVHYFQEGELIQLAEEHGFKVMESFYSDGKGGRLSLYQVWGK